MAPGAMNLQGGQWVVPVLQLLEILTVLPQMRVSFPGGSLPPVLEVQLCLKHASSALLLILGKYSPGK
jgi:hypothetical protein